MKNNFFLPIDLWSNLQDENPILNQDLDGGNFFLE